jgi:hypothetical protein
MAALSEADRQKVWRGFMRYLSDTADPITDLVKQDIKDAVDSTDAWIDANSSTFNTSLPANFQANASPAQKALLFSAVALMRYDEETLKKIFTELT